MLNQINSKKILLHKFVQMPFRSTWVLTLKKIVIFMICIILYVLCNNQMCINKDKKIIIIIIHLKLNEEKMSAFTSTL